MQQTHFPELVYNMRYTALFALTLLAASPLAAAQTPPAATPVQNTETGTFNGHRIRYLRLIDATEVPAPHKDKATAQKAGARIVSMAYVAKKEAAQRPVIFAFNGGPIASSYAIQMGLLGPQYATPSSNAAAKVHQVKLKKNTDTVLDTADLVFYDPAGTGFSRAINGTDVHAYYNDDADAQELADFITAWLKNHHRENAPVYIAGESYGTLRASLAAGILSQKGSPVHLAGVILLGQAVNAVEYSQRPANTISFAVSLPTEAAVALHFHKVSTHGKSEKAFLAEVSQFAGQEYLPALYRGHALPQTERKIIADKLAGYTGIPASYYLSHNLRIRKFAFHSLLLKDSGRVTGVSDGSYSLPDSYKGDAAHIVNDTYIAAIRTYMKKAFPGQDAKAYTLMIPYKDIKNWTYAGSSNPYGMWPYEPALSHAFKNPKFRLMIIGGWYDLETTMGAAQLLANTEDWPANRISTHFYPGGHMVYANPASRKKVAGDIRAFVSAGK